MIRRAIRLVCVLTRLGRPEPETYIWALSNDEIDRLYDGPPAGD